MATATPTQTLRERLVWRLEAVEWPVGTHPAIEFDNGIGDLAAGLTHAWYGDDLDELRGSEVHWLDRLQLDARTAAKEAAIDAAVDVLKAGLRRLADSEDPTVPAHLLEQGTDELREDVALVDGDA